MFLQIDIAHTFKSNKVRTGLSLASIAIGAASIIAIVSLTLGYASELERLNFGQAANRIAVTENFYVDDHYDGPRVDDWRWIKNQYGQFLAAAFARKSSSYVARTDTAEHYGILYGVIGDYSYDTNLVFARGRNFSSFEIESNSRLCLLGSTVANQLITRDSIVGRTIRLNRSLCRVVGVIQTVKGRNAFLNESILMPFGGYQQVVVSENASPNSVDLIEFFVVDEQLRQTMISNIDRAMRQRHGAPAAGIPPFLIGQDRAALESVSEQRRLAAVFLLVLGSLTMLSGVIGVANSMLASVTERKKEIGIRLAIGATPSDIRNQFLGESVALSSAGVLVGTLLGMLSAAIIAFTYEWPIEINLTLVMVAVSSAFLSGIGAGLYPAIKAASYPPSEVIRAAG